MTSSGCTVAPSVCDRVFAIVHGLATAELHLVEAADAGYPDLPSCRRWEANVSKAAERLHDFLDLWAERQPDVEFAVQGARRLTYREAQRATVRLAEAFLGAGLQPGDRIAVLAKNCIEYPLIYLAASRAGVVPVPLNYRSAPTEWEYVMHDSVARLLLVAGPYLDIVDALSIELGNVHDFVALGVERPPAGWTALDVWVAEQQPAGALTPSRALPTVGEGEQALPGAPLPRTGRGAGGEGASTDDLYQLYTSGTTGQPKGAVLTQAAVVANLTQLGQCAHRGAPGARSLVVGPMLHAGVVWSTLAPLSWGASLVIVEEFDAFEVVRLLGEERIDYASLVPTVLHTILERVPDVAAREFPALRLIHTGSAPVSERTLLGARAAFKCDVVHGYGLTESTAALSVMAPDEYAPGPDGRLSRLRSVGRALPGTELRIVDDQDRPLPPGEVGEIVARGPQLMRGYWRRPQATAETMRGGWLHTGDVGLLNADGFLYIQDRLKDVIVTGGLKVYPQMVEQVLTAHPAVVDAAVIGVPDERWGESVRAVVVPRAGHSPTEAQLIHYCHERLGGFQCPKSVGFVATLPRTATGKVLKRSLRESFWSGQDRRIGEA
jgi:acyl-CoA synthetase (AMP-forming)/AMP-acid ligase II